MAGVWASCSVPSPEKGFQFSAFATRSQYTISEYTSLAFTKGAYVSVVWDFQSRVHRVNSLAAVSLSVPGVIVR